MGPWWLWRREHVQGLRPDKGFLAGIISPDHRDGVRPGCLGWNGHPDGRLLREIRQGDRCLVNVGLKAVKVSMGRRSGKGDPQLEGRSLTGSVRKGDGHGRSCFCKGWSEGCESPDDCSRHKSQAAGRRCKISSLPSGGVRAGWGRICLDACIFSIQCRSSSDTMAP